MKQTAYKDLLLIMVSISSILLMAWFLRILLLSELKLTTSESLSDSRMSSMFSVNCFMRLNDATIDKSTYPSGSSNTYGE